MGDETDQVRKSLKPPRRWFQFRLRTLLVAVVAVGLPCAYLAHEATVVRARRALMSQVAAEGGSYLASRYTLEEISALRPPKIYSMVGPYETDRGPMKIRLNGENRSVPSKLRRWLGDLVVVEFFLSRKTLASEMTEIHDAFPEADIWQDD